MMPAPVETHIARIWLSTGSIRMRPTRFRRRLIVEVEERLMCWPNNTRWRRAVEGDVTPPEGWSK